MSKNAIEQGILFLLVVITLVLFAFFAYGAPVEPDAKPPPPDSKVSQLTRIVPYSQNFEADFRQAIGEMMEEIKENGCKEGRVMATMLNPWMVEVTVTCTKFYEETKGE